MDTIAPTWLWVFFVISVLVALFVEFRAPQLVPDEEEQDHAREDQRAADSAEQSMQHSGQR